MKKFLMVIGALLLSFTALAQPAGGRGFQTNNLINGYSATFYVGTGNNAVDYLITDSYATNRTYVNPSGTTITPFSTNSVTGQIYPSFQNAVALRNHGGFPDTNVTITAQVTTVAAFDATNIFTLTFTRSADGGQTYDTVQPFAVQLSPGSDATYTLTTNLPLVFLSGSSHIRLYKASIGANPTDNANVTINRLTLGGFGN